MVQVRYQGFTKEGRLRAPVFLGLRPDADPKACHASAAPPLAEPEASAEISLGSGRVRVSNPDKVFWPESGYTKGDLCSYYASIAPKMLPFLRGRPLVLVRHPDGIAGKSFYQWNVPEGTPSWMRRLDISDTEEVDRSAKHVFLVDDEDGLVYLANLGCIPLHVLACREQSLGTCDFLTVDFDLGERPFSDAVRLGLTLREVLDPKRIVLTVGGEGVVAWDGTQILRQPAQPTAIIDRLGAGDALAAGVIHGWLDNDFAQGLRNGAALAALALRRRGDIVVCSRDELAELTTSTNPNLIGGFTVSVGSTLIDASVNTRLNQLRGQLLAAAS